jgi:hypothetical protein
LPLKENVDGSEPTSRNDARTGCAKPLIKQYVFASSGDRFVPSSKMTRGGAISDFPASVDHVKRTSI